MVEFRRQEMGPPIHPRMHLQSGALLTLNLTVWGLEEWKVRAGRSPPQLCHMGYQGAIEQRKLPSVSPKTNFLQASMCENLYGSQLPLRWLS